MKRSQINRILEEAQQQLAEAKIKLPVWAAWNLKQWQEAAEQIHEIREHGLGWIVTDFGSNEFDRYGLVIFVARNGCLKNNKPVTTKTYAEKFMLVRPGQITPYHFHWMKTEDLVNRSGGRLKVQLAWAAKDELSTTNDMVLAQVDGVTKKLKAGEDLILDPGESVELPPRLCHQFSALPEDGKVLAGEISSLNDDGTDNCFLGRSVAMKPIEEDEAIKFPLSKDYATILKLAASRS
jgi:D-lyxose ketol-isomerase